MTSPTEAAPTKKELKKYLKEVREARTEMDAVKSVAKEASRDIKLLSTKIIRDIGVLNEKIGELYLTVAAFGQFIHEENEGAEARINELKEEISGRWRAERRSTVLEMIQPNQCFCEDCFNIAKTKRVKDFSSRCLACDSDKIFYYEDKEKKG